MFSCYFCIPIEKQKNGYLILKILYIETGTSFANDEFDFECEKEPGY